MVGSVVREKGKEEMKYQEVIDRKDMAEDTIYVFEDSKEIEGKGRIGKECVGYAVDKKGHNKKEIAYRRAWGLEAIKNSMFMLKTGGKKLLQRARNGHRDIPDIPKENLFPVCFMKERIGSIYEKVDIAI